MDPRSPREARHRRAGIGAVLVLGACGRVGFDSASRTEDAASTGDAGLGARDGAIDWDALIADGGACAAPAPFVSLVAPREEGSDGLGTFPVVWCSAGVAGALTLSLRRADTQLEILVPQTAPVEDGGASFVIGDSTCLDCFLRLEVDGLVVDGPRARFVGM